MRKYTEEQRKRARIRNRKNRAIARAEVLAERVAFPHLTPGPKFVGRACGKCLGTLRYVKSGHCIGCSLERSRKQRLRTKQMSATLRAQSIESP